MDFRALILTALVCCIGDLCYGREVFGRVEGEVTLNPKVDKPISSITWKNGLNKAVEWEKVSGDTDNYTICKIKPRCQLNTATGELTILHLQSNETLYFSAEINGMAAQSFFTVIAVEPVSKPSVRKTCENTQCTLVCEGKNSTYTKYSWMENNEMVADDNTTLHVLKSDKLDKIYTCVVSNPVSTLESDPVKESDLFPVMEVKEVFGRVGGKVTLIPKVDQPISSITWKNGLNKAVEWEKVSGDTDYYTICKTEPRCQLNTATGELTIMHLKLNEKLNFTAAVNGNGPISCFPVIILAGPSPGIVAGVVSAIIGLAGICGIGLYFKNKGKKTPETPEGDQCTKGKKTPETPEGDQCTKDHLMNDEQGNRTDIIKFDMNEDRL